MNDDKTNKIKYSIFLILSFVLVGGLIGSAYADNSTQFNATLTDTIQIENQTITNQTNPIINNTIPDPVSVPEIPSYFTNWFNDIMDRIADLEAQIIALSEETKTKVSPVIENTIPKESKSIPYNDCSQYEILKKDWLACQKYNQGIASDKLTEKRINDNKAISRGF